MAGWSEAACASACPEKLRWASGPQASASEGQARMRIEAARGSAASARGATWRADLRKRIGRAAIS